MLCRTLLLILLPLGLLAQDTMTLTGRITNYQTGEPIGGVNVLIPGSNLGGASSETGIYKVEFALNRISSDSILIFVSHVGYTNAKITLPVAPGISVIDFRMRQAAVPLPEVVVEGDVSKATDWKLSAAFPTRVIGREELDKIANNNVAQVLTRVAGIRLRETGKDISTKKLYMRGRNRMPLIVIDDVPYGRTWVGNRDLMGTRNPMGISDIVEILNTMSVSDIERIEIVKGSGMFFRFGEDAMYGTVMIYTRKARAGNE